MSENKNLNQNVQEESAETRKEYAEHFIPSVHKIGRITMGIAMVLAFLPTLYFLFIKGYNAGGTAYANVFISIFAVGIGMWLTEPVAYWPILGSAGTYISYLSGNVGAMRFPVAANLQAQMKADINTSRGQIVTIVGIVSSVFVNLVLLLAICLGGEWLIAILPAAVMGSFSFVMQGLYGSLIYMRLDIAEGFVTGLKRFVPYAIIGIIVSVLEGYISWLWQFGMAIAIVGAIILSYVIYKKDCAKDAKEA